MIKANGKKGLEGVIPALILPVHENGKIDFKYLEKQITYFIESDIDGIFINGTTGEGAWLTTEEKVQIFKVVKEINKGKKILCAACIQPSTELVIKEMQVFEKFEPDYIVVTTPYYYSVTQDIIREHFKNIAQASFVPVIMYNIPQCTNNKMSLSTILELTKEKNIAGIKDSSGDFILFSRGCSIEVPDAFSWIQGEDYLDGSSLNLGAKGIVTGLGNVFIDPYIEMFKEAKRGNEVTVRELQKKINGLYEIIQVSDGKTIPAIKAAVSLLGRSTKWMKVSSLTLGGKEIKKIKNILENLGLV